MLVSKTQSVYDIIRGMGLLYEIAKTQANGTPARLYGIALERYNMAVENNGESFGVENSPKLASELATEFLEWAYNSGPVPEWL